jgi:S1-C subfamily serine protease
MSNSHVVSGRTVVHKGANYCTIVENAANPLGFIQFFDPEQEGVAAESAADGVRVTKATAGKPFHQAGLRPGDLIASINGETLNSAEAFRKILRKHHAWEEPMTFHVLRDGQALEIQIPRPQ